MEGHERSANSREEFDAARRARLLEEFIDGLGDVHSVRVVMTSEDEVDQIHVLSSARRGVAQVIQDVATAVLTRFGIEVDPEQIFVTQLRDEQDADNNPNRFRLMGVSSGLYEGEARAEVELRYHNRVYRGEARGLLSIGDPLHLVARATVQAVEKGVGWPGLFHVEDVRLTELNGSDVVNVAVRMASRPQDLELLGSAYVRRDKREATAKATLSAINRHVGPSTLRT